MPDATPLLAEAVSPAPPASPSIDDDKRLAFLLYLLASAPKRQLTQGKLNKKLGTKPATALRLTRDLASSVLDRCGQDGFVSVKAGRGTATYTLTEAGASHLDTLRSLLPTERQIPGRGQIIPPENDQIRERRTVYLLLQVVKTSRCELSESDATKKLTKHAREGLELNAATVRHLLGELASHELVTSSGSKPKRFTIAPVGWTRLANWAFPPDQKITLNGHALHALLEAAREIGKEFVPSIEPTLPPLHL